MKLLLDTHVLLWWLDDPLLLSEVAREFIQDSGNEVLVSAASFWEIAIKRQLGKLKAPERIEGALIEIGLTELPVTISHAMMTERLPMHHRDPFDRLLIAQAMVESALIITRDSAFEAYQHPLVRA